MSRQNVFWVLASVSVIAGIIYFWPFPQKWVEVSSSIAPRSLAQRHNLEIAIQKLSGQKITGKSSLALNPILAPYAWDQAYLPDKGFVGGKTLDSPGGGVCQLASTLYYAVLRLGLPVQRVAHQKAVSSMPPGLDATLSENAADLKIFNPHWRSLQIRARIQGERLFVSIWGPWKKVRYQELRSELKNFPEGYQVRLYQNGKQISEDYYPR